jgi:flagellar biogenesis protein FliO
MISFLANRLKQLFAKTIGQIHVGRGLRRMELIETLNLGGKRQLMLVVCDGERFLIGSGGDSVQSIERLARVAEPEVAGPIRPSSEEVGTAAIHARRLH